MIMAFIDVDWYEIDMDQELGSGTFGLTVKARDTLSERLVIAKRVKLDSFEAIGARKEIQYVERIKSHPNVLKILHHRLQADKKVLWLFCEYCEKGNLSKYNIKHRLSLVQKLQFMHQAASGLMYMNTLKPTWIIHRNVKPSNILITGFNGVDIAKVADFGVAQDLDSTFRKMSSYNGTLHYMAPELCVDGIEYDESVDVFSLGVVIYHFIKALYGQELESDEVRGEVALGRAMQHLQQLHQPMWSPVAISMHDSSLEIDIKKIVAGMVQFEPSDRLPITTVERELRRLLVEQNAFFLLPKCTESEEMNGFVSGSGSEESLDALLTNGLLQENGHAHPHPAHVPTGGRGRLNGPVSPTVNGPVSPTTNGPLNGTVSPPNGPRRSSLNGSISSPVNGQVSSSNRAFSPVNRPASGASRAISPVNRSVSPAGSETIANENAPLLSESDRLSDLPKTNGTSSTRASVPANTKAVGFINDDGSIARITRPTDLQTKRPGSVLDRECQDASSTNTSSLPPSELHLECELAPRKESLPEVSKAADVKKKSPSLSSGQMPTPTFDDSLLALNTPRLHELACLSLLNTKDEPRIDIFVAFSRDGEALFGDTEECTLVKIRLDSASGVYVEQFSKKEDKAKTHDWVKFFTDSGDIVMRNFKGGEPTANYPTLVFNSVLSDPSMFAGPFGRMVAGLGGRRVMYRNPAEKPADSVLEDSLDVYEVRNGSGAEEGQHEMLFSLGEVGGEGVSKWSAWVSACTVTGGQIVVTDGGMSCQPPALDFYDMQGRHRQRAHLSYTPHWVSALATSGGWLFVAEARAPRIHIHDLEGVELAVLGPTHLGLAPGDMVWAVGCAEGGVLQVAVGTNDMWHNKVHSIRAYKLSMNED